MENEFVHLDSNNSITSYETYENLRKVEVDEENLKRVLSVLRDYNGIWTEHFDCLNYLRVLQKFYCFEFIQVFSVLVHDFHLFINSIRSNISKISLMLIEEIYFDFEKYLDIQPDTLIEWTKILLPNIFLRISAEKKFIKLQALKILKNLQKVGLYDLNLLILKECKSKSSVISDEAFKLLELRLKEQDFFIPNEEYFKDFMIILFELNELKREIYTKKVLSLFKLLKSTKNTNNLDSLIEFLQINNYEQLATFITNNLNAIKTQENKTSTKSLKEYLTSINNKNK